MARTGLYKSEVKKARDSLVFQGKHPSVDAVRIALGNTGSKTTIHKYLKELMEDGDGQQMPVTISEALQNLVGQLAAQLQVEADAKVNAARLEADEAEVRLSAELNRLRQENADLAARLADAQTSTAKEKMAHEQTSADLQERSTTLLGLQIQATALKERLEENERHRLSIEEKHQHARESLEHYRTATKEQRDQDIRRHETQVHTLQAEIRQLRQDAIIKSEEVTRLNQEGVRLVAELSHAKQALYESQKKLQDQTIQLDELKAVDARNKLLVDQLEARDADINDRKVRQASLAEQLFKSEQLLITRQSEVATLAAKLELMEMHIKDLRTYMLPPAKDTNMKES